MRFGGLAVVRVLNAGFVVAFKPSQKLVVSSIPVGRTFFVKKRKRRKPHLRVKIGLCGERKLNLLNIKMMLMRKSDL